MALLCTEIPPRASTQTENRRKKVKAFCFDHQKFSLNCDLLIVIWQFIDSLLLRILWARDYHDVLVEKTQLPTHSPQERCLDWMVREPMTWIFSLRDTKACCLVLFCPRVLIISHVSFLLQDEKHAQSQLCAGLSGCHRQWHLYSFWSSDWWTSPHSKRRKQPTLPIEAIGAYRGSLSHLLAPTTCLWSLQWKA